MLGLAWAVCYIDLWLWLIQSVVDRYDHRTQISARSPSSSQTALTTTTPTDTMAGNDDITLNAHRSDRTHASVPDCYAMIVSAVMIPQELYEHPSKKGRTRYGRPASPDCISFRLLGLEVNGVFLRHALDGFKNMPLIGAHDSVLQDDGVNVTLHILVSPDLFSFSSL